MKDERRAGNTGAAPDRAAFDAIYANISQHIAEHGWSVMFVGAGPDGPPYSYTIGASLTPWRHEAVVVGLHPGQSRVLLNKVVTLAVDGVDVLDRNVLARELEMAKPFLQLMPIDRSWLEGTAFQQAKNYLGLEVAPAAFQLVLADPEGRFPWDEGCTMPSTTWMWVPPSPSPAGPATL